MKNKILLSILLLLVASSGFCTVYTVNNSGNTYTPATITVNLGDTVDFVITSGHDVREVSQATWNANGNTPLAGGFSTGFGGGKVYTAQLSVGTHYYVCTPHASFGMKGSIIVQNTTTGLTENHIGEKISLYPNPSNGIFQLTINETFINPNCKIEIYNIRGERIYNAAITDSRTEINLSNQTRGIYFVKMNNGSAVLTDKIVIK